MLDRWYHPLLESRMGTFSFRTCMSSQTQSSAQAQVRWIQSRLQTNWEHNVEPIMNSNNCKHRNDTARDTTNIEWHVCFRNTSFQLIQSYTKCMSQNGHEPESFPDKTSFTSMFNDFADCIKECVWTTRKNWPSCSKIQIWLLVFPWSKHASNKYIDIKDKKPIHTKWHFWRIWRCMTFLMGKRSKQDNINETKAISRKVHFATLVAFCNLKHSESAEHCYNMKAEQSCEEISPTTILVATRFSPNKEHQRLT